MVEITDNRLVILALLEEVADILQLNLYNTQTHRDYRLVLEPATQLQKIFNAPFVTEGGDEVYLDRIVSPWIHYELLDQEQMWMWISADRLPADFRTDLVRHLCHRDELQEHIAGLSQTRYERLRTWTNTHV